MKHAIKRIVYCILIILFITTSFFIVADIESRKLQSKLELYLQTYFPNQKLIDISSADEYELNKFIITQAMCHGMVYQAQEKNGYYCLNKYKFEENIRRIVGNSSILIRIDPNQELLINDKEEYILENSENRHSFIYIIHEINKVRNQVYTATLSYIDTVDGLSTYTNDGKIIYNTEIFGHISGLTMLEQLAQLKTHIINNPDDFEKQTFTFKLYNEQIYYLSIE